MNRDRDSRATTCRTFAGVKRRCGTCGVRLFPETWPLPLVCSRLGAGLLVTVSPSADGRRVCSYLSTREKCRFFAEFTLSGLCCHPERRERAQNENMKARLL